MVGYSSHVPGRGDNQFLPPADEGKRRETNSGHGGLPRSQKSNQELKSKLIKIERDIKSVEAALDSAKRQAKGQQVLLHQAEDQLATSKEQTITLKKKLEEAEKAKDQADQKGYDIGVAEIEEAFRAEVSRVCRNYCLQVWNEALNQTRIKASSKFRRVECVYYPFAIRAPASTSSKADTPSKVAKLEKDSLEKIPLSSGSPPKEVKQLEVAEKEVDTTKGVTPNATKPSATP